MIETWDFYVRLMAIGGALLLIAQMVAGEIRDRIKFPVVFMLIGAIAYLMSSTPLVPSSRAVDPWIALLSLSVPFWIWLFARNLFEREAGPRVILVVASVIIGAWSISNLFAPASLVGFYIIHFVSLGLIIDLVRVALLERDDDLVEERRIIRLWLPLLVAAQAGTILATDLIFVPNAPPPAIQLLNTIMILALIVFAGLALLRTNPELLIEDRKTGAQDEPQTKPLHLTPSETVLYEKLNAAMVEGVYRETGLSIVRLAERLDTPEHRLRALINQRLGYRNFSAFLNYHRITEAREKLTDKTKVDVPVLTIAMDLGYNSLPTFNRAFRSETGTTPTNFRRLGVGEAATSSTVQN